MCGVQAGAFKKMQAGDFSDIVAKLLSPKVDIEAPVFFDNAGGPDSLISGGCAPLFCLCFLGLRVYIPGQLNPIVQRAEP